MVCYYCTCPTITLKAVEKQLPRGLGTLPVLLKALSRQGHTVGTAISDRSTASDSRSTWEAKAVEFHPVQSVKGKERPQRAGNEDPGPPAQPTVLPSEFGWEFRILKLSSFTVKSVG